MSIIVCKFGGTSVASSERIEQVLTILNLNPKRKCVILSAPGKAPGNNIKVTDLLINIVKKSLEQIDITRDVEIVEKRYHDIYQPLGVSISQIREVCSIVKQRLTLPKENPALFRDAIVASGEEMNTRLFAELLNSRDIKAKHVSPAEGGMLVTTEYSDAQPLTESYRNLAKLKELCAGTIVVFPGFLE
jgi:aspartate kinase